MVFIVEMCLTLYRTVVTMYAARLCVHDTAGCLQYLCTWHLLLRVKRKVFLQVGNGSAACLL